ncbi:MAG: hypothetical protein L0Z55_04485 [Planctomycetes bacterium]|nr:hypothetical protein [Planctomycetota bacterium]
MAQRKSFLLRVPAGLYRELQAWAEQELRSVNAQIEFLLREAVARRGRKPAEAPGEAKERKGPGTGLRGH